METLFRLHSAYKYCRFTNCRCIEPRYKKGHISAVVRAIDSKFATKIHRTMQTKYSANTKNILANLWYLFTWTVTYAYALDWYVLHLDVLRTQIEFVISLCMA